MQKPSPLTSGLVAFSCVLFANANDVNAEGLDQRFVNQQRQEDAKRASCSRLWSSAQYVVDGLGEMGSAERYAIRGGDVIRVWYYYTSYTSTCNSVYVGTLNKVRKMKDIGNDAWYSTQWKINGGRLIQYIQYQKANARVYGYIKAFHMKTCSRSESILEGHNIQVFSCPSASS